MIFSGIDILFRLFAAHILSDFVFQPNSWVSDRKENKAKSKYLYMHVGVTGILAYLFMGHYTHIWVPLIISGTHLLVDIIKSYLKNDNLWLFILDQIIHLLVIILCWLGFTKQFGITLSLINDFSDNTALWVVILGYILMTIPLSVLISKITQKWSAEINDNTEQSLEDAGKWIGILERILIFTFIIIGQFEIIGFLLAAKSVFRFGDLKDKQDRKRTEYILIGTLLSFSAAIFIGMFVKMMIGG
ncbi:MAG: DUF3307 domain-containing protein [Bacteroidota bacterium]